MCAEVRPSLSGECLGLRSERDGTDAGDSVSGSGRLCGGGSWLLNGWLDRDQPMCGPPQREAFRAVSVSSPTISPADERLKYAHIAGIWSSQLDAMSDSDGGMSPWRWGGLRFVRPTVLLVVKDLKNLFAATMALPCATSLVPPHLHPCGGPLHGSYRHGRLAPLHGLVRRDVSGESGPRTISQVRRPPW